MICSAKGCRAPASWALRWNNPRLHTPERRKTWLACDAHRDHLRDFLAARGFLRELEPFSPGEAGTGPAPPAPATPPGPATADRAPGTPGRLSGSGGTGPG